MQRLAGSTDLTSGGSVRTGTENGGSARILTKLHLGRSRRVRRSIRCGAIAAALVLLLASCSGSKRTVSSVKAAPRGDIATCAKYEASPTRRAQCLLLTGPDKHDLIPEIGRRADLDTQVRCHPVRFSVDWYAHCLGLESQTGSLDEEQRTPSAHSPAATASRTPPSMGPESPTFEEPRERIPLGIEQPALSDAEIREELVRRSIALYPGSCPCPYSVDRAGRRCGGRSAYSRPGGGSPICYDSDVTQDMVERFMQAEIAP
jgi:hypothetical protein